MSDYPILMRCANCLLNEHPDCPMTHYEYYNYRDWETDRKSTRLNSSHSAKSRMPSSA